MAINIHRRNALAASFNMYPDILEQFVINHCELCGELPDGQLIKMDKAKFLKDMMQICMAQFCVRVLQSRANNANSSALDNFVTESIDRYHKFTRDRIGNMVVTAPESYRKAMAHYENNMGSIIFAALTEEARIIETVAEKRAELVAGMEGEILPGELPPEPEDIDEGAFWHDVFLALAQNQRPRHPLWITPIQEVVLNHLPEFKAALNVQ